MLFPIMQFGTSRFLQAHADLFISEALADGDAPGPIVVVQTTSSSESNRRINAFNKYPAYRVLVRGIDHGRAVERQVEVTSIRKGLSAGADWPEIERIFTQETRFVVSNTGDKGYVLHPDDQPDLAIPLSFPAKLVRLLLKRWELNGAGVTFLPCELTSRNGEVLRDAVIGLARQWDLDSAFLAWLRDECLWVNSLVDRIVSEPLDPIGAIAEPYALWAVEDQPKLVFPCRHPNIQIVRDLRPLEWLKLFILNLGHSVLAELWIRQRRPSDETVSGALQDPLVMSRLNAIYDSEVIPIFSALGMGDQASAYRETVIDRFLNPFLRHRLADIAANHQEKKQRRIGGLLALAREHNACVETPLLHDCLGSLSGPEARNPKL